MRVDGSNYQMVVYPNDETKFPLCSKLIVLEEYIIKEFSEIGAQTRAN